MAAAVADFAFDLSNERLRWIGVSFLVSGSDGKRKRRDEPIETKDWMKE
jgi:hypothetical protein